ncbi:hypothetical protein [Methylibium petroleiphilum]|nr:hypothetical protein [Methylibium petroleiphilum]
MELREERDDWLGRTVRVARFFTQRGHDVFPRLIEAQLIYADVDRLILNGIERDELTRRDQAQTWVLHTSERPAHTGGEANPRADRPQPGAQAPDGTYEMLPP